MTKKNIAFATLGCAKNTVYTEYMMGLVEKSSFALVEDFEEAHVIVINTCGFITAAKEETINTILELSEYKENGKCEYLVALGCMVQKYASELEEALPEIDLLLGSTNYDNLLEEIQNLYRNNQITDSRSLVDNKWHLLKKDGYSKRVLTTPSYYAYLTISEGCNNHCTFCAIPEMQGPYRSRQIEDILLEAEQLAAQGVKELIIIAQDITYYGKDIYGEFALAKLLKLLCNIEGFLWIRLLYAYPNNFSDDIIDIMAKEDKICNYIDIPLQHADDKILKSMNRQITQEEIEKLILKLRSKIPGIVIRSTFIVGFPGETDSEYNNLLDFLQKMKLDRVGVFPYSQEENTPAGIMPNQVEDRIKEKRAQELMEIQYNIMFDIHKSFINCERLVLIDEVDEDNGILLCRSYSESPDIDPYIVVEYDPNQKFVVGQSLIVKIIDVNQYDLVGRII